jgi:methyl halide transferase
MSQDYWEQHYQSGDTHWDKGAASPGLVDFLAAHPDLAGGDAIVAAPSPPGLTRKDATTATMASQPRLTVCVPGCGTGHDVRAWAQAGFNAFGFDIAPSAIRFATEKTKAAASNLGAPASRRRVVAKEKPAGETPALPGGLNAQFQMADFLRDEPPFQFDWLFEHTLFCAIQPGERDDYVRALMRWLKPGGQYLAVNYLIIENDDGPPFRTTREEQVRRFSPHFELVEDWVPRSYANRTGRERMFWWRRNPNTR